MRTGRWRRIALALLGLAGCTTAPSAQCPPASALDADVEMYRNAQIARESYLEREVKRLRTDLQEAERAMVAIESGLRSAHTRADAVSAIAEARIELERAQRAAPWRTSEASDAHSKLDEAERQLGAGHAGTAVFFASRARRTAETLSEEALQVTRHAGTRFTRARRVNLRSGPSTDHPVIQTLEESTPVLPQRSEAGWMLVRVVSGPIGWIHADLLAPN